MIYRQPSIYKSGEDIENAINDNMIILSPKILDKYKSYVDWEGFESNQINFNKLTKVFLCGMAFLANNSFTPYYSDSDGGGDTDWPIFAYFEMGENYQALSNYFPLCASGNVYNKWGLTSNGNGKVLVRLTKNFTIPAGYNFLLSGNLQLK